MKSCRNCERAVNDGYFDVRLLCNAKNMVVVPFSKSVEENKAYDTQAQTYAATCGYYIKEV
jgi:hypothetical protein